VKTGKSDKLGLDAEAVERAARAMSALAQALRDEKSVALVRGVLRKAENASLSWGVLSPFMVPPGLTRVLGAHSVWSLERHEAHIQA
jgi:hypothetical protein